MEATGEAPLFEIKTYGEEFEKLEASVVEIKERLDVQERLLVRLSDKLDAIRNEPPPVQPAAIYLQLKQQEVSLYLIGPLFLTGL